MLNAPSALQNPALVRPSSVVVSAASWEGLQTSLRGTTTNGWASAAWPTTNLAILYPFTLRIPYTVASLWVFNGATASGNFDLGIYDDGAGTSTVNRLISLGSTAQSGTSVPQSVAAAITLAPGTYYMACVMDGTTGTASSKAPVASTLAALGFAQAALGSVVLPSTISLALMATAYFASYGFSMKATV